MEDGFAIPQLDRATLAGLVVDGDRQIDPIAEREIGRSAPNNICEVDLLKTCELTQDIQVEQAASRQLQDVMPIAAVKTVARRQCRRIPVYGLIRRCPDKCVRTGSERRSCRRNIRPAGILDGFDGSLSKDGGALAGGEKDVLR